MKYDKAFLFAVLAVREKFGDEEAERVHNALYGAQSIAHVTGPITMSGGGAQGVGTGTIITSSGFGGDMGQTGPIGPVHKDGVTHTPAHPKAKLLDVKNTYNYTDRIALWDYHAQGFVNITAGTIIDRVNDEFGGKLPFTNKVAVIKAFRDDYPLLSLAVAKHLADFIDQNPGCFPDIKTPYDVGQFIDGKDDAYMIEDNHVFALDEWLSISGYLAKVNVICRISDEMGYWPGMGGGEENAVAYIKKIREVFGWGLKEAKDLYLCMKDNSELFSMACGEYNP